MKTMPFRGAGAILFISIQLTGLVFHSTAHAYYISYSHYVYATGGASPESDNGTLHDGPTSLYDAITHVGEPLAPNEAQASYFADIDPGTVGAYALAAGGLTNFWPYGFTATGRVVDIGFDILVDYLVPAGEYSEGVTVSATGRVTGNFSADFAASAQGQYSIHLGAGNLSPPLTHIENEETLTLNVDELFELSHQTVAPGTELHEPSVVQIALSATFSNMTTSSVRTGTSPNYVLGSAEDSFYTGIEFMDMIVPEGVTWSTDTGVFLNEEDVSAVGDTPRPAHLKGNFPNPFNPSTTISCFLPESTNVALSVFDLSGKLIRVLDRGRKDEGLHTKEWNGLDDSGQTLPSGIYICTLESGNTRESRKMMLVR